MKTIKVGNAELKVKVAVTGKQQARGLMEVEELPDDQGMLFCYPEEKHLSFWMKKTPLPLSIAFINKDKKIVQIENLKPFDEAGVKTEKNKPAKWALEVNQGWFERNKVKVGDKVDIPSQDIKINIVSLPQEAEDLAKTIEDKLVDMTMTVLKSKLGIDKLGDLNIEVEVE